MREAFKWRAPSEVDDVLRIDCPFVGSEPAQRQTELRLLVAKPYIRASSAQLL